MKLPTLWENAGLSNVDGVIWFYKEINLKKEDCESDAFLSLGRIADQSVTFFNGTKLGSSIDSRDFIRDYPISKNILHPGVNRVMVRVANKGRNGGMWGPESLLYFKSGSGKQLSLAGNWKYYIQNIKVAVHPNDVPSSIYNAMINPLKNLPYKGVIWYQGESSANWANEYEGLLKIMIKDWRSQFQQSALPFIIIQLPNYKGVATQPEVNSTWALLREAQANATQLPNVGLVNIIDLGLADNIHPTNKTPVGERTALKVEQMIYGKSIIADGPVFKEMDIKGSQITLTFSNANGLKVNPKSTRSNFMIAGKDQKFVWAEAKIVGNSVIVWNKNVKNPVAVRYAWADNPGENYLYNAENLPMQPFRTDNWEIVTEEIPR
jgi:sialate O-acetylesterase